MSSYIFTEKPNHFSCATVGWQDADLALWGVKEVYKKAADDLVEIALEQGSNNNIRVLDTYIFPIMYLYRQCLEVSLKIIYHRCYGKVPFGHSLPSVWKKVYDEVVIGQINNEDFLNQVRQRKEKFIRFSTDDIDFIKITKVLNELQQYDKESDVWRYFVDKTGKPYFTQQKFIDYNIFKETMNELYGVFDFLYGVISEYMSG